MKLNNKGYMLVELVLSSALAFIVAYFLLDLTIKVVNKNEDKYVETVLLTDKALITKEIMDDVTTKTVTKIVKNDDESLILTFKDESTKTLSYSGHTITYGNFSKILNNNYKIGEFNITPNNDGKGYSIKLPITTKYSTEDFGLNFTIAIEKTLCIPSVGVVKNFDFINDTIQDYSVECDGTYKLEVWGAQGGSYDTTYFGGKGGYSYGNMNLATGTTLYVGVGGQGSFYVSTFSNSGNFEVGGFNGGGGINLYVKRTPVIITRIGTGGGATHIGYDDDTLANSNANNVLIVAGGGAGANFSKRDDTIFKFSGGAGGGISGGGTYPGTQSASAGNSSGGFGFGASNQSVSASAPGGGGGYYGGGRYSSYMADLSQTSGGGSGYVSSDLSNANTIMGSLSITDPDGSIVTGHSGNGYARITYLYGS